MPPFIQIALFSAVMFAGSYLSGSAPLLISLTEEKLQRVSVFGAGLLLGTALAVIIPEAIQTLIQAFRSAPSHNSSTTDAESDHHDHLEGLDRAIGVSLVLGFIFMLLIDQLASSRSSTVASNDSDTEAMLPGSRSRKPPVTWTTTLGLLVHAAADGVALGAAASTHQTDVEIIVFLAIMLHKAPAAFGLTTFLLHEGLDRKRVKRHLMAFSLSAPILTLLTFMFLSQGSDLETGENTTWNTMNATGIAMLFSAGTFLYVATIHVLPEVLGNNTNNQRQVGHSHNSSSFAKMDLLLLVLGSLLPLVLTMGHHH